MTEADELKQRLAALFSQTSADHDPALAPLFNDLGNRLVDLLAVGVGDRVLDVAAGSGATLVPAARRVGPSGEVVGADVAPGMVQRLDKEIESQGLRNAHAQVADAEDLPFPAASFDAVVCAFGLFFFPHAQLALAEFRRVLRPGGKLGISTFARSGSGSIDGTWRLLARFTAVPSAAPDEARFHDHEQLEAELRQAGFTRIELILSRYDLVLPDLDAWLVWIRSMEFRDHVDGMDEATFARFRRYAAEHFAGQADAPAIRLPMDALLTRATKP